MFVVTAEEAARLLPYSDLIEALRAAFKGEATVPPRQHHQTGPATTLLVMPAWTARFTGIKTVTVKTDNPALGHPVIQGSYLLIDNETGAPAAIMDGTELTRRRTAAASALAADFLARPDASSMVMVGAGSLARHFVRAHASVRPIKKVSVYSRTHAKSEAVAADLRGEGFDAAATDDLEKAVRRADIVSCATGSSAAIVKGEWLKPGTHLDLAGAYKPGMREVDAEAVARARVWIDTLENARTEAGDLIQAAVEGRFAMTSIQGDLFGLCQGTAPLRRTAEEITLFKSCGIALEDLAAAVLVAERKKGWP